MASSRYVVLSENRTAFDAVTEAFTRPRAFSRRCGGLLLISGPSDCGKSTLVNRQWASVVATGRSGRGPTPLRMTAARFAEMQKKAECDGTLVTWLAKLAASPLILLEAVHTLGGRSNLNATAQLEALLDQVRERGGLVVATLDRPSRHAVISERLADRLSSGVSTAIEKLSVATRAVVAQYFADRLGVPLSGEAASRLALKLGETVGEVEKDVTALQQLTASRPDSSVEVIVDEFCRRRAVQAPTISMIAKAVAREFSARVGDLRASGRSQAVVLPRQTAMFLARTVGGEPYQAIGDYFGKRNHSTVVHSVKRIERLLDDGDELAGRISAIHAQLS